jgi:hypothetical protein
MATIDNTEAGEPISARLRPIRAVADNCAEDQL